MKIAFTPITAFTKEQVDTAITPLSVIREGHITADNLAENIVYPINTLADGTVDTNPIVSDKFFYGEGGVKTLWDNLYSSVADNPTYSLAEGIIQVAVTTDDPSGVTEGTSKTATITFNIGENKKLADWSFFPYLEKKDSIDSGNKIPSVDIYLSDPLVGRDSVQFVLTVSTGKISDKEKEYFACMVFISVLLEDYQ